MSSKLLSDAEFLGGGAAGSGNGFLSDAEFMGGPSSPDVPAVAPSKPFGEEWAAGQQQRMNPPKVAASAAPEAGGFFSELGTAFKRSILSQNPQSLADSLEMGSVLTRQDAPPTLADGVLKLAGRITDPIGAVADDLGALTGIHASDVMKGASDTVRGWAKAGDDGSKPSVPTLGDIHNMSDAVSYVGSAIGNAAGSSAPSLVAGTAVAAATKNPVAGFFAGAFGPSYIQNSGDTYATLRDNPGVQQAIKDGKITDKQVAGWAAAASVPIAALDAYGAEKMLPIQKLKGEIVSRVLKRILIGGATEGGTEGFQQVLQEATLAAAGGDHTLADAAMNVIESTVQGTIGGTAVSAVTEPLSKEQPSAQAGAGVAEGAAAPTVTEGAGVSPPPSAPSRDSERLDSPRLTAADRASPLPNDLIDEGKKVFEEALGKKAIDVPTSDIATPAMRAEAEKRAADIATPASQPAPSAIEHTIEGTLTPAEAASAPGAAPTRLLSDEEFMGGVSTVDEAAHAAATSPQNALPEPTQAMKEAGNYKVGKARIGGLDLSIENPQGSTRSGVDPNGKPWTQEMQSHYGYIKGTVGKDKDHVDVFVKPGTPSEMADDAPVFVVDQVKPDGKLDEHKVMMGFADQAEADAGYHANYQKGWKGAGAITQTTLGEFKGWLANGDTTKPFATNLNMQEPATVKRIAETPISGQVNSPSEPAAQTALKQKIKAKREPDWWTAGKTVNEIHAENGDAEFILDDREKGLSWRRVNVPIADVVSTGDLKKPEADRLASVQKFVGEKGHDAAPILGVMRDDGKVDLLDGFHRIAAARAAGRDTIAAHVGSKREVQPSSEKAAKPEPAPQKALKEKIAAKRDKAQPVEKPARTEEQKVTSAKPAEPATPKVTAKVEEKPAPAEPKPTERAAAAKLKRDAEPAIQPTDAFKAQAQAIGTRLRAELDRLGLKDIGLRVSETLGMMVEGKMHAADGQYFQKLITIALDAENPDATLAHEAVHALRALSLFGKDEWAILERQSRKKWMEQHKIAEAYGAFPEWVQVEEGIAHAYGEWSRQGSGFDGIIVKAFRKIKAVLRAIARAFGKDFTSIEDVFAKIDSGEVGSRPGNVQFISSEITNELFSIRRDERRATDEPAVSVIQAAASAASQRIAKLIKGGTPDEETRAQYTMRKMVDYLQPVRTLIESVGGTVQDTMNAYLMARLADDTVIARIQDMHGAYVTPMVDALAAANISLEEFHRYLYARHAEERNRVVGLRNEPGSDFHKAVTDPSIKGASGMSTNEANKILAKVNADPRLAGYRQAEAHLRRMTSQNLLAQKNAGLISEESYKTLTEQWRHWVPLRGEEAIDENGNYSPGKGRGFDVRGKEFQGATGRFSEAENIPAWAISLAERSHMRGEHNNVGKAMLRFVAKYDPAGQSIAKVYWTGNAPGPMGIDKQPDVYQRVLDKQGKVADRKVAPSTLSPSMFAVKVGGQTFYIEFADENVGLALKKMGGAQLDAVSRVMRLWTGWQSLINTRANPAFIPINAIRDAMTGGIHLLDLGFSAVESAKVLTTIPKAWAAIFRNARGRPGSEQWDTSLKEYIASGGKISFDRNGGTIEDSIKQLGAEMDRALRTPGPVDIGRAVVKWLGDVNDAVESGMRLAAYAAMREKGKSPKGAALASRDLTVDFKKHGEIGPYVNAWVLFFNAALQGNYNVAANLLKSKKVRRAAYAIAASGILVDLLNRTLTGAGGDDDDNNPYLMMIRNEPWKMERSMIIFYGAGDRDYISVPLPFGYNAIYHMGLQMGMVAHGDATPMQAIADSARVTFDAYNPLGSGNLATMFLPSIATPALELWANKNFMGAPIYPEPFSNDHSPLSQHSKTKTSETAKTVAEGVNALTGGNEIEPGAVDIPPDVYDYLWGYVSGGIGRFLSQTVNVGQKVATGKASEIEPNDIPIARSLYGRIGADTARSEFYKMREQVETAKDHLGDYKAAGDAAETQDFIDRNKIDVESIPAFDAAEKRLRKIRKQRRRIEAEGGDTSALDEGERKAMDAARMAYARNAAKER